MSEEIRLPDNQGAFNFAMGVSAFMFYMAVFIFIMGDLYFGLWFVIGGIFFIVVALSERIRADNWLKADLFYFIAFGVVYSIGMGIILAVLLLL